jgi:hypothetical protein
LRTLSSVAGVTTKMLESLAVCLALVIFADWYRRRGKRAADAAEKQEINRLKKLGVKMEE